MIQTMTMTFITQISQEYQTNHLLMKVRLLKSYQIVIIGLDQSEIDEDLRDLENDLKSKTIEPYENMKISVQDDPSDVFN